MPTATATAIGPIAFVLENVEHGVFPAFEPRPFCILSDGAEVHVVDREGSLVLVIDHRRDQERSARIETWRPEPAPEAELAALYVLCEALR